MSKYSYFLSKLRLEDALWWFIENNESLESNERTAIFFDLRQRMRERASNDAYVEMTDRKLATILAALRVYQDTAFISPAIMDIATSNGQFNALSHDEIDQLCEELNQ